MNGDLLCINIDTGLVGYVFHDDLWEEDYDVFDEIYIELPYPIDKYIISAMEDEDNFPCDGTMAEQYAEEMSDFAVSHIL